MYKLLILLLIVSCGKIKVETNLPKKIEFGPDFAQAISICDERYGKGTVDSEACFQDYRSFLSPKISFDFASINTFCKGRYTTPEELKGCEDDLLSIISKASGK